MLKSSSPLLSIIVPVYNAEKYLARCIDSILSQRYEHFELILVNDGSKDASLDICNNYKEQDDRIIVLSQENRGASAARNKGLDCAAGDYISFVDSDDYISKCFLLNLVSAAALGNYDIVQCDYKMTESSTDDYSVDFNSTHVEAITEVQAINGWAYNVVVWNKLYKKDVFNNFRFREGDIYEDDAAYYRLVDAAKRLAVLKETLYFYFMAPESVFRNSKKEKSIGFVDIYHERIAFYEDKEKQQLLEGSYSRYCVVLMLFLASSHINHHNEKDKRKLWCEFKKFYPLAVESKSVSLKEKTILTVYRYFSILTDWFIVKLKK